MFCQGETYKNCLAAKLSQLGLSLSSGEGVGSECGRILVSGCS